MGHYDDAYEDDAEQRQKERVKQSKKLFKLVQTLRIESKNVVPDRFIHSLQDYENWLKVNEDLIGN